jgi:hypothetical protein
MTTIDKFLASNHHLYELENDLSRVRISEITSENIKLIWTIAKTIAAPVIIIKNIFHLRATYSVKRKIFTFIKEADKLMENADEMQRVEIYAEFHTLTEAITEVKSHKKLNPKTGGFLTKKIRSVFFGMANTVQDADDKFYKIVYPENPAIDDPEYVKHVLLAHQNA